MIHKNFLIIACILGALSVILGAFGAHALKKIVPPETVVTFETGVRYQFYHVFALLAVAILFEKFPGNYLLWSGYSFITGIILFSGSLYVLTLIKSTASVGLEKIGIITPFGGLFLIMGWIMLLAAIIVKR